MPKLLWREACFQSSNQGKIFTDWFNKSSDWYITLQYIEWTTHQIFWRPTSLPRWGLLDSPEKMRSFQNFSGVRPSSKFSTGEIREPTGETTKPIEDDMKIQRGDLTNILLWLKNIYTWFTQKHINGWVTFKCHKILRKISLRMKTNLKV